MAEVKLSILLLMVSSILSLEANFLDIWSSSLDWLVTNSLKGVPKLLNLLPW
jgi:hypothetical protein